MAPSPSSTETTTPALFGDRLSASTLRNSDGGCPAGSPRRTARITGVVATLVESAGAVAPLEVIEGPGAVVVVMTLDAQIFAKGYGLADIGAKKPFTADATLVRPGSISKLFTGIAVMQLFLHLPIPLYGTLGILIWAFVINYLPYGMRYSAAGMLQIHRELEESAEMCGASALTRLRRIVAPLLAPALLAGWLFIFLMAARVLSLAILLSGPRSQTMAVTLFDLWTNGQGTELAALGLIWSMLMAMIAAVFYILARRSAASALART